jgi:transmembrane sensor
VARTTRSKVLVRESAAPEVEQLLSWRSGYVNFRDTSLADAVAEFNRYSARKIVVEDPAIANFRIAGNFRSNNVNAFLWLLETGFAVEVQREDERVILKGK